MTFVSVYKHAIDFLIGLSVITNQMLGSDYKNALFCKDYIVHQHSVNGNNPIFAVFGKVIGGNCNGCVLSCGGKLGGIKGGA